MIEPIDALLTGRVAAGIWSLPRLPDDLDARIRGLGWFPIVAEGDLASKDAFLAALRAAAEFPDWVGNNWDAFEDAMTDLSWLPPGPLLVVVPATVPTMAIDILGDVSGFWERRHRRFGAVVHGELPEGRAATLPRLDQLPILVRREPQSPPRRPSGQ